MMNTSNTNLNTVKHSNKRERSNCRVSYNRFFQTKGGMDLSEFEKHLKK